MLAKGKQRVEREVQKSNSVAAFLGLLVQMNLLSSSFEACGKKPLLVGIKYSKHDGNAVESKVHEAAR